MKFGHNGRSYFTFLPDMISLLNLYSGFLSILMVSIKRYEIAVLFIILAFIWDSLDGNISRLFKNPTPFGRELDSLADVVSFILAPAFLLAWFLIRNLNLWVIVVLFAYLGAGAVRLARFNVRGSTHSDYFEGLPTPAAGLVLGVGLVACIRNGWGGIWLFEIVVVLAVLVLSVLMVSQIRYPKFSALSFRTWHGFLWSAIGILLLGTSLMNIETGAALVALFFVAFSPWYCYVRK